MTSTKWLLSGLIGGLILGGLLPRMGADAGAGIIAVLDPVGVLWVNAIRMTVVPLVISLLIVTVGGARDAKGIGRLGRDAFLTCLALLVGAAIISAIVVPPLMKIIPLSSDAVEAMKIQVQNNPAQAESTSIAEWIKGLIPSNPVKAAADASLLPLVIFSIFFGVALSRLSEAMRDPVVALFRGISEVMLMIVKWVLAVAPIGVFALAVPLAAKIGWSAAGAFAYYVTSVAVISIILIIYLAVTGIVIGRARAGSYLRNGAAAQAVAFSARSSLASLPALVRGAEAMLWPDRVVAFFLPLAVATFRVGAVAAMLTGTVFLSTLYGVQLNAMQVIQIVLTAVLISFSVPGVPGGSVLVIAPVLANVGIPTAGLGLLLALDAVPDMFRTMTNVTGDFAAASILSRNAGPATVTKQSSEIGM
ncbi:MAG TPA: cation:dicarboxylase symporter family transporter [Gemmatimonadaceae bacterium]